ncbi:MAG: hypothetical protein M3301_04505 [Chloroflexota bacterium]|nr:hypothetical protein [Chloroflexota bacterium]
MERAEGPLAGEPLRIRLTQAGGITGGEVNFALDTDTISATEARELERLVDECRFFDLRPRRIGAFLDLLGPPRGFDVLRYEISIRRGSSRHRVAFDDLSLPPELCPLVDRLAQMARATTTPK